MSEIMQWGVVGAFYAWMMFAVVVCVTLGRRK